MSVNYNEISKTYDNVRSENKNAVELFIEELKITDITRVLDFGCGTGNYADVGMMFAEIGRVLKNGGNLCIVTESHKQIDNRFYVKYFPSTAIVDKGRYPDIDEIVYKAQRQNLVHIKNVIIGEETEIAVTSDFVEKEIVVSAN